MEYLDQQCCNFSQVGRGKRREVISVVNTVYAKKKISRFGDDDFRLVKVTATLLLFVSPSSLRISSLFGAICTESDVLLSARKKKKEEMEKREEGSDRFLGKLERVHFPPSSYEM